jgi:hypothetical protein
MSHLYRKKLCQKVFARCLDVLPMLLRFSAG